MSAKLQAFGQAVKSVLLYILTPIFFILGCFYLLWTKQKNLENEIADSKADQKLEGLQNDQKTIDTTAAASTQSYEEQRAEYLAAEQPKKP